MSNVKITKFSGLLDPIEPIDSVMADILAKYDSALHISQFLSNLLFLKWKILNK